MQYMHGTHSEERNFKLPEKPFKALYVIIDNYVVFIKKDRRFFTAHGLPFPILLKQRSARTKTADRQGPALCGLAGGRFADPNAPEGTQASSASPVWGFLSSHSCLSRWKPHWQMHTSSSTRIIGLSVK